MESANKKIEADSTRAIIQPPSEIDFIHPLWQRQLKAYLVTMDLSKQYHLVTLLSGRP